MHTNNIFFFKEGKNKEREGGAGLPDLLKYEILFSSYYTKASLQSEQC